MKQDGFEQGRVLERIAQTPLVLVDSHETHDLVSLLNNEMIHRSNENLDGNSSSAKNKFLVMT